eukprot:551018_1
MFQINDGSDGLRLRGGKISVIERTKQYCDVHHMELVVEQQAASIESVDRSTDDSDCMSVDQSDEMFMVIDGGGTKFDARRVLQYMDTDPDYSLESHKQRAAKMIIDLLTAIKMGGSHRVATLHRLIAMRLYAPTYYYQQHRDNTARKAAEINMRRTLHEQRRWNELVDRIMHEQRRINAKKKRRRETTTPTNYKPNNEIDATDEEHDDHKS